MGRACSMIGGRGMHMHIGGKGREKDATRKTKMYVGG
jgi:hypothetical protein